ncbi:MAG: hypothetical protein ACI36X_08700 [Bacteroidaceae bacterium]
MKNLSKNLVAILASIILFSSCNTHEQKEVIQDQTDVQTLMLKLQALNKATLEKYNITDITKGGTELTGPIVNNPVIEAAKRKWWQRLLAVIGADAMGATIGTATGGAIGGAALGIIASIEMYRETGCLALAETGVNEYDEELSSYTIIMDSINHNLNNELGSYDVIGDCHNVVIQEIIADKERFLNEDGTFKADVLANAVLSSLDRKGYIIGTTNPRILSFVIQNLKNGNVINKDVTLEEQVSNFATLYPEQSNEAFILKDYITTVSALPNVEAVKSYSYEFERVLLQASPGVDLTINTLAGVSVGKNSASGWNIVPTNP